MPICEPQDCTAAAIRGQARASTQSKAKKPNGRRDASNTSHPNPQYRRSPVNLRPDSPRGDVQATRRPFPQWRPAFVTRRIDLSVVLITQPPSRRNLRVTLPTKTTTTPHREPASCPTPTTSTSIRPPAHNTFTTALITAAAPNSIIPTAPRLCRCVCSIHALAPLLPMLQTTYTLQTRMPI